MGRIIWLILHYMGQPVWLNLSTAYDIGPIKRRYYQPEKSLENIDLYLEQHLVIPRITVLAYEETSEI